MTGLQVSRIFSIFNVDYYDGGISESSYVTNRLILYLLFIHNYIYIILFSLKRQQVNTHQSKTYDQKT